MYGFIMKHEDFTPALFQEIAERHIRFFEEKLNLYRQAETPIAQSGEQTIEEFVNLLRRLYALGIEGLLVEGNLLPADFEELLDNSRLEALFGYSEDDGPLTLLKEAVYGRLKLCFYEQRPLAEIYELTHCFEDIQSLLSPDLTHSELAALSNMSIRSVRNEMLKAPKDMVYKENGTQYINIAHCAQWLKSRIDFKPTKDISQVNLDESHLIIVPVAADGSYFSPACAYKRGGYTVGEKGDEIKIDTFDEALAHLVAMPHAKWRRPNASGNYGIVSAVDWKRVDKREL